MDPAAILETLAASGAEIVPIPGYKLRITPPDVVPDELRWEIVRHKRELMWMLAPWSEHALKCERQFGSPWARLYVYVDRKVYTPNGDGRLFNVLGEDRCRVLLDYEDRSRLYHYLDVVPLVEE